MAADLQIHVLEGCTERQLAAFNSHTFGSKYFNLFNTGYEASWEPVGKTPSVWVGEVSWLKAALTEDAETFVPNLVGQVSEIIGENLPVIDDEMIAAIGAAFSATNITSYSLGKKEDVLAFLEAHKGKKAFTISW